jgi:hypothetical protein
MLVRAYLDYQVRSNSTRTENLGKLGPQRTETGTLMGWATYLDLSHSIFMEIFSIAAWQFWKQRNSLSFENLPTNTNIRRRKFQEECLLQAYRMKGSLQSPFLSWVDGNIYLFRPLSHSFVLSIALCTYSSVFFDLVQTKLLLNFWKNLWLDLLVIVDQSITLLPNAASIQYGWWWR